MTLFFSRSSNNLRRDRLVVAFGVCWGLLATAIAAVTEPTPDNLASLVSIPASGLYTVGLFVTRSVWRPWLAHRPVFYAALLGIFNAAVVETIFVTSGQLLGAENAGAHPHLLIDLVLTMPWYGLMVPTFMQGQHRQHFSPAIVLLLGAVYELGADGVVPQIVSLLFGDSQLLNPVYWLQLALFAFWTFIPVYSSMVLAPTWLIKKSGPVPEPSVPAWVDAFRPLVWLPVYTLYVMATVLIFAP